MREIWARIRYLFGRESHVRDVAEELDTHLDMEIEANVERGMSPDQARDVARRQFGSPARLRESADEAWAFRWLESILQDIRYGSRQFRRAPGLFLAVVASLAIGLGSNSAIFSLIDAAILRPLPVGKPDRLIQLGWNNEGIGRLEGVYQRQGFAWQTNAGEQSPGVSEALFRAFAEEQTGFVSLVGSGGMNEVAIATLDSAASEQVRALYVSTNFFEGLGVAPVRGRSFLDEEDRPGSGLAVIVSHRFWSTRFGAADAAIGRTIRVNDVPARIAGVAPPGFFGLVVGQWVDVYAPLAARRTVENTGPLPPGGWNSVWWVQQVARLAPGVRPDAAAAAMTPLFRNLAARTNGTPRAAGLELVARPAVRGLYTRGGESVRQALWTLMLLVGVVLLIVCANVANLLLARSVRRQHESAVRLALGSGRRRLVRQQLVESGMLAAFGGAAGLGLGIFLARSLHAVFQTGQRPGDAFSVILDSRVLVYAGIVSLLTALVFGLAPAWTAARSTLNDALKSRSRSVIGGGFGLPKALVSIQFALSFAALVSAGLLTRTLENLHSTDVGVDSANLAYAMVRPTQAGYPPDQIASYLARVEQELRTIPGVVAVAPMETAPLGGFGRGIDAISTPNGPPPRQPDGTENPAARADWSLVGPGVIETLGIPLTAGRTLEERDRDAEVAAVVINRRFAEVFFPGETPVGQRFNPFPSGDFQYEVVGVVGDVRITGLRDVAGPTLYTLLDPEGVGSVTFAIRSVVDPVRLGGAVGQALARVDPSVPVVEFHTQSGLIDRSLRTERLLALVSGWFGFVAAALAAIGLGGVLAYAVALRRNEIGIRMTLGATGSQVRRMVLGDSVRMAGAGILIGIPAAYIVGRYLESQLFGLEPIDPTTASLALVVLLAVTGVAALVPARRAARVDPLTALREE